MSQQQLGSFLIPNKILPGFFYSKSYFLDSISILECRPHTCKGKGLRRQIASDLM